MRLADYLRILRGGWQWILLATMLGLAGAIAACALITPTFESTTKLFVSVRAMGTATADDLYQGDAFVRQKIQSYVEVATTPIVLEPVIEQLGLTVTPARLAEQIEAYSRDETVLMEIVATDDDPRVAARLANAVASSLRVVVVDRLEEPIASAGSSVELTVVQRATPATAPSSPDVPFLLALGVIGGFALGSGLVVLRALIDTRIRNVRDLEALTDAPVLGSVSHDPVAGPRPLVVQLDPRSPRAESFRALRTSMRYAGFEAAAQGIVFTSSVAGEGKSTTVANLGIALAQDGASVVVVDGDLRAPRLAEHLGLEGAVGLSDVLIGRVALEEALQLWGERGLQVLASGPTPPNPSELLGSKAMRELLERLARRYEYVLVDAPPLLPVTDAAVLSKQAGGAVLLVAAGRTRSGQVETALRSLQSIDSKVLGIVLTMVPTKGVEARVYGGYGNAPAQSGQPEQPDPDLSKQSPQAKRHARPKPARSRLGEARQAHSAIQGLVPEPPDVPGHARSGSRDT